MTTDKLKRLQVAGWKVGNAKDFLKLSPEEATLVEIKLSQIDLALRMKSSQSRVAKIEAGDPSVSLDLIMRALIASGTTKRDIQLAMAGEEKLAA